MMPNDDSATEMAAPKTTRREPWCWLEKKKLRVLSDVCGEGKQGSLAAARSVMLALSEIVSDRQSDTFVAAIAYIAQRAGVAKKTACRAIKTLGQLGFVKTRKRSANGLKMPSEYILIRGKCPLRLSYPSMSKSLKPVYPEENQAKNLLKVMHVRGNIHL